MDIDENLSWKTHINKIQVKVASVVGILSKIRYKISTKAALLIYDALINSHLQYCNIAWASTYKSSLHKLYTLQKRTLKICLKLPLKHSSQSIFSLSGRQTIYNINVLQQATFVYKSLNKMLPIPYHSFFKTINDVHEHDTRSKLNIHSISVRTNVRKFSIKIRGQKIWNSIPNNIRCASSEYTLKKSQNIYLKFFNRV